ncbi:glycoside hydrolase family 3 C-terminal domain-containing protein [Lachnoclostridium sp. Marseille-P6806]|uniref:glycoside hydrolase family 3 C-terminal domain-containing protein n=1 Tax=Lachnoclostridium sp. Marseille-P6806 TaxID=2364793 RepID=UPI0010308C3E|nr:glycoside hydrolase family 3 C-terminal domain-containing protein [Lachnoclostridium sp. Marseille-P6806]
MRFVFDWQEYAARARQMAAEGAVLLRNEDGALPLRENECVSFFGRCSFEYYKSGTGSGGMVNAPYVVSIPEGLCRSGKVRINEALRERYLSWIAEHPFDKGPGWAQEPFSQQEMPLTEELVAEAAAVSGTAIVVIGRSAGEDRDAVYAEGSYLLSPAERNMLRLVCGAFRRTVVLLNVGSIMDMSWVAEYRPQAVMYIWQGGQEGGNAAADLLTGTVSPSGRLSDTIAEDIKDYPSTAHFGDPAENVYAEDIYVGYRYFETFAKDRVLYPFGFGLSYTSFAMRTTAFAAVGEEIRLGVSVKNTGSCPGKEVVQVYYQPPQGALTRPRRNLIRLGKTQCLEPGEEQELRFVFSVEEMSAYDDTGATGRRSAWVLEAGSYKIYVGSDVRRAAYAGKYTAHALRVTEQLEEACAPARPFDRMIIAGDPDADRPEIGYERVAARMSSAAKRIAERRPEAEACTGDRGIRLADVRGGRYSMEEFLAQIPDEELIPITRGEGMCSPKVTPGVAAAFGGVTEALKGYGIPVAACADGPSGIRMDSGTMAFSSPSGTAIACSFNTALTAQLYEYVGRELRMNHIDTLLGPGINIHRNPLNGRNFEYFSEDPYVTGTMAAAELLAMHRSGTTGTIKHFACNNQETKRSRANPVVSERALREIYLKPFEIAVKQGGAYSIMTTYGPLNGIWTAGNYDLNTAVLRGEWGYAGIVMTDWWAEISDDAGGLSRTFTAQMIRAQNDLYMVVNDAETGMPGDNAAAGLSSGVFTRGELVRSAANICRVLMNMPAMDFLLGETDEIEERNRPETEMGAVYPQPEAVCEAGGCELDASGLVTQGGSANIYSVRIPESGSYRMIFTLRSELGELAQSSVAVYVNNTIKGSFTVNGTEGGSVTRELVFDSSLQLSNYIRIYFAQSGLSVAGIRLVKEETA